MAGKLAKCYHDSKVLFPLKAAIFCFYGAVFSLIPFLTSHMKALGLPLDETLSIYAVVLLAAFVAPPIVGYLYDVTSHLRLILVMLLFLSGVFHTSLLAMPSEVEMSHALRANLLCTDSGGYLFVRACSYPDPHCLIGPEANWASMSILECHHRCRTLSKNPNVTDSPPPDPQICFPGSNEEKCEPFSISMLSPSNFSLMSIPSMYESRSECVHRVQSVAWGGENRTYPRCPSAYSWCTINCSVSFSVINGSRLLCDQQPSLPAFPAYFILRLLCAASLASALALFETSIVTAAEQHKAQYGKQKVWAYVAAAIFTPIAGKILDGAELRTNATAFYPLIVLFDVLLVVCMGLVTFVGLSQGTSKQRSKVQRKSFTKIFQHYEGILLLGAVFFLGAFWGVLGSFLLGFLEELGGTKSLLGLSEMVGSLICIPIMYFADSILNKCGRMNILSLALFFYGFQLLCYSFLSNPWSSLAIEILNIIPGCLKVAAMVTLAHQVAPVGKEGTTQGTVHCLHYNVGAGLGIVISGALAEAYHLRISFRTLGVCSLVIGVVYAVWNFLMKRKEPFQPTTDKNGDGKEEGSYLPETGV